MPYVLFVENHDLIESSTARVDDVILTTNPLFQPPSSRDYPLNIIFKSLESIDAILLSWDINTITSLCPASQTLEYCTAEKVFYYP